MVKKKLKYNLRENEIPKSISTVYENIEELRLPKWVIDQIDEAVIVGNNNKTIIVPDGRRYYIDNPLNDLSGGEWLNFTSSVFQTRYNTNGKDSYAHSIRKIHPTPKPPQLMREIIEFFTKEGELVFDYFMGVGGTLLGASLCNREAIGIDLNDEFIYTYKKASKYLELKEQVTICGDSLSLLANNEFMKDVIGERLISLVLIDPPYSNMMSKGKTGADILKYGPTATPFTKLDEDLGNMTKVDFLDSLRKSVELVLPFVKKRGYVVLFIKDIQPSKKNTNLLHSEVIEHINKIPNVYYKGLRVWVDLSSKLFPYGYPFSYVSNQIHQYILIFRKENIKVKIK